MSKRGLAQRVRKALTQVLKALDGRPATTTGGTFLLALTTLLIWSAASSSPVLLARASPDRRTVIYGEFAQTSVAIVAVALTVLAILYALPDRLSIRELRRTDTWPRLQSLLLSVGLLALLTLICAHVGTALDHTPHGLEWLEEVMLAAATTAVLALLIAGITFALVLHIGSSPSDPSEGRGMGSRQQRG